MKKILVGLLLVVNNYLFAQNASEIIIPVGVAAINYVAADASLKEMAKDISQFRSKEYIVNYIIGSADNKEIKFETESLASDNDAGLISIAFNCTEVNEKGLLMAFMGLNRNSNGVVGQAYGFRYIPLKLAQELLLRIDSVKEKNKKYLSAETDINNIYIQFEDIKFIIYKDGGEKVRVLWNGFEVVWEDLAFDKTKKRLNKWFE